ncbi:MAG TPA: UxaA family hydrolase [Candidatus Anoxymicrobiaceae bacterium]
MEQDVIVINEADNVGVARRDIAAGDEMALPGGGTITAAADVPRGHKIALAEIGRGGRVIKYGECIGLAATDIRTGDWVHTHNLEAVDRA